MSFSPSFAVPPSTPPAPAPIGLVAHPSSVASAHVVGQSGGSASTGPSSSSSTTHPAASSSDRQQPQQPKPSPLALNMAAVSPPTPAPSPRPSEAAGLSAVTFYGTLEGRSGALPSVHPSALSPGSTLRQGLLGRRGLGRPGAGVLRRLADRAISPPSFPFRILPAEDSQTAHLLSIFSQLPASSRTHLLQALLPLLSTPELLLLSSGIAPRLKRDFLRDLPLEIALHVLSFVDEPRTLARASCVSRFWRRLLEDEWTWKEMCARHRFAATAAAAAAALANAGGSSSSSSGLARSPSAGMLEGVPPVSDAETVVQEDNDDLTMFGSPRLGIVPPGAPRMARGGLDSPAAFPPPPFVAHGPDDDDGAGPSGTLLGIGQAAASSSAVVPMDEDDGPVGPAPGSPSPRPARPALTSPSSSTHAGALADFFRSLNSGAGEGSNGSGSGGGGGGGHSAAAVAVREALDAPSPASFLTYALASVHAPAGMSTQFPFATADEDESDGDDAPASTSASASVAADDDDTDDDDDDGGRGGRPILSPSSFLASLTNTLGLPYGNNGGTPTASSSTAAAPAAQGEGVGATGAASRLFLPRGLGLAPFPARTVSLGAGSGGSSSSSPLAGSSSAAAAASKGKGKAPRRRMSAGAEGQAASVADYDEDDDDDEEETRFSYKRHFKRAYLTGASCPALACACTHLSLTALPPPALLRPGPESNWLRGGRLLSTHTSTDDGVVTSLAVDDRYIVIGMANCKIHVFDAGTGTFLRTLVGHELGVWCLTLISAGGERKEAPKRAEEDDDEMDGSFFGRAAAGAGSSSSSRPRPHHHRRRSSDGTPTATTAAGAATDGSSGGGAREPVLVGGTDSPFSTGPHGLFGVGVGGGLSGSPSGANPGAGGSTASLPSFDAHFHASASRRAGGAPRPKVAQSDVCGASKGFGQSRTLIVSGGCDRDVRVWDAETGCVSSLPPLPPPSSRRY